MVTVASIVLKDFQPGGGGGGAAGSFATDTDISGTAGSHLVDRDLTEVRHSALAAPHAQYMDQKSHLRAPPPAANRAATAASPYNALPALLLNYLLGRGRVDIFPHLDLATAFPLCFNLCSATHAPWQRPLLDAASLVAHACDLMRR